jgi:hypothetical protein
MIFGWKTPAACLGFAAASVLVSDAPLIYIKIAYITL